MTRLDHNFIEPQDVVTDARYVFTYNAVNQVTERSISNSSYVFANLTDEDKLYTSNGLNQYTSICTNAGEGVCETGTAQAISYDDSGNLTHDGTWTYTYDAENRMVGASRTGLSVIYQYDPKGRRFAAVSSLSGRKEFDGSLRSHVYFAALVNSMRVMSR